MKMHNNDRHDKSMPPDSSHSTQGLRDLLSIMLIISAAIAALQVDAEYGAAFAAIIFMTGMAWLFLRTLYNAIRTLKHRMAAGQTALPRTWPPTLPQQWPPVPPTGQPVARDPQQAMQMNLQLGLQMVAPMLLAMMVLALMGSYSQMGSRSFIPEPARYMAAEWGYLGAGIAAIALLWLSVYRAVPRLFRHDVYLKAKADPILYYRFALALPILVVAIVINLTSFPKAVLQQLHEHTAYTVFEQDALIRAKSDQDDDLYALTLQTADGQSFVISSNEVIYDQTVIGSTLHLAGTQTRYGRLVVEESVTSTMLLQDSPLLTRNGAQ